MRDREERDLLADVAVSQSQIERVFGGALDTPVPIKPKHLRASTTGEAPFCGGVEADDGLPWYAESDSGVNCAKCRAEVERRQGKADLTLLRKLPVRVSRIERTQRWRLEELGLVIVTGAWVLITPKGVAWKTLGER